MIGIVLVLIVFLTIGTGTLLFPREFYRSPAMHARLTLEGVEHLYQHLWYRVALGGVPMILVLFAVTWMFSMETHESGWRYRFCHVVRIERIVLFGALYLGSMKVLVSALLARTSLRALQEQAPIWTVVRWILDGRPRYAFCIGGLAIAACVSLIGLFSGFLSVC